MRELGEHGRALPWTPVPVCRIHDAKFARWGDDAEVEAILQWGWEPPPASGAGSPSIEPRLTSPGG